MTADATAQFGFDYATKSVPPAPRGGGDTIGLKLEANNNAPASLDDIAVRHADAAFTGQYTLRADVWINWALVNGTVGTGTTEFAGLSVGHNGVAAGPNGASFLFDGDGDTTLDYRFHKDATLQATASGQYAAGVAANAADNGNAHYSAFGLRFVEGAAPGQGQVGTKPAGAGGFQWMTVNVEVDVNAIGPSGVTANPGFARVSLRSDPFAATLAIGTIDNSNGGAIVNMGGSIALLASDIFNSVTTNPLFDFALFDNVKVLAGLVPLPPTGFPTGDFDFDVDVDGNDFLVWQRGATEMQGSSAELLAWRTTFGQSFPSQPAGAPVPEPGAAMLVVTAVALMTVGSRARARRG